MSTLSFSFRIDSDLSSEWEVQVDMEARTLFMVEMREAGAATWDGAPSMFAPRGDLRAALRAFFADNLSLSVNDRAAYMARAVEAHIEARRAAYSAKMAA